MTTRTTGFPPGFVKPRLRGWLHLVVTAVAVPAAAALVVDAPSADARSGFAVYGLTLVGLFGVSAAYHRGRWRADARARMRLADHSMIWVFIAGSHTPAVFTILDGWRAWATGLVVWAVAAAGVGIVLSGRSRAEAASRRRFLYVAIGWCAVVSLPDWVRDMGPGYAVLYIVGGLLYALGAMLFLLRRPDPVPLVFGYHEVWHCFVVAACACQFVALRSIL